MKKFLLYSFTAALFSLAPTMVNAQTTSDGDENTEPTPEVVATPVIDPAGGAVAPGTEITITCATEGATIYYTTDGSTPTNESYLINLFKQFSHFYSIYCSIMSLIPIF